MNTVLSILLIIVLLIAIYFDYVRIVQHVESRKMIHKNDYWAECQTKAFNSKLGILQTSIDLVYAMEKDNRTYKDTMFYVTADIREQILKIASTQCEQSGLEQMKNTLQTEREENSNLHKEIERLIRIIHDKDEEIVRLKENLAELKQELDNKQWRI